MCNFKVLLIITLCYIAWLEAKPKPPHPPKNKCPPKGKPNKHSSKEQPCFIGNPPSIKNPPPIKIQPIPIQPIQIQPNNDPSQSCNSKVYCQGKLLDIVQRERIFSDSKTFVDLAQVNVEEITLQNFNTLLQRTNNHPTKEQVEQFVKENFNDSQELENWTPPDFKENPSFLNGLNDNEIKHFAKDLVAIWPNLGRKISASVFEKPNQHSLIGVKNGFIIPGGRFKEFYYWDSYWIIEGLIISEMVDTAKGMIENLISMVQRYGFVPNGGRVYYLNRSQPPLLTQMAMLYVAATKNMGWLRTNIQYLEQEMTYWLEKHTENVKKNGKTYQMARYYSLSTTPRPESYYEDVNTCAFYSVEDKKKHCYQSLKSGAETGWDFSSRWLFDSEGGVNTNLSYIDAQRVVPVDLNAFLARDFHFLALFYQMIGQSSKAKEWKQKSMKWKQSIEEVLYDEHDGIWYDYDIQLQRNRKLFYPSNFAPLWTRGYDVRKKQTYGRKAADYFEKQGIEKFMGGVPTSLINNGEQWDLPNAWAPLQEFVVLGLYATGESKAKKIAKEFAQRWVESNMKTFEDTHAMYEKYNAIQVGQVGGGGEYSVQTGFGWTNGVCLKFIQKFYTNESAGKSIEKGSHETSNENDDDDNSESDESNSDSSDDDSDENSSSSDESSKSSNSNESSKSSNDDD